MFWKFTVLSNIIHTKYNTLHLEYMYFKIVSQNFTAGNLVHICKVGGILWATQQVQVEYNSSL